jgi:OOP family OmpA-OmpF porin
MLPPPKYLSVLFLLLFIASSISAQKSDTLKRHQKAVRQQPKPFSKLSEFRTWSIGLNVGIITPYTIFGTAGADFKTPVAKGGYGGYFKKQFLPSFGIQFDIFAGSLQARDIKYSGTTAPYLKYDSEIKWTASLSAQVTLTNINWLHTKSFMQPYFSFGAGAIGYSPTLYNINGSFMNFSPFHLPYYIEMFIPLGVGVKFKLAPGINLDMGYKVNFIDADNLDGYKYGDNNDKFSYIHAGFEFALGSRKRAQLATYNPVAAMRAEYLSEIAALKKQVSSPVAVVQPLLPSNNTRNDSVNIIKLQLLQLQSTFQKQTLHQKAVNDSLKVLLSKLLIDTDADGVADVFDRCPGTPAGTQVDGSGCPLPESKNVKIYVTEADKKVIKEAIANLEFDVGTSIIRKGSLPALDKVAQLLIDKNFNLKLAGFTDNLGVPAKNLKLSKNRADAIKNYLVTQGANPLRIEAAGYGVAHPIASNKTAAGRARNRRVEFLLF